MHLDKKWWKSQGRIDSNGRQSDPPAEDGLLPASTSTTLLCGVSAESALKGGALPPLADEFVPLGLDTSMLWASAAWRHSEPPSERTTERRHGEQGPGLCPKEIKTYDVSEGRKGRSISGAREWQRVRLTFSASSLLKFLPHPKQALVCDLD